ncbi:thiamine pyrophosphate protein domain protein TPP-binding [Alkaliphilus metalliredigens QYMF]|uniref:Thiamine pyrophosphate protein domain protein TPP-binding n=1 Tax=Alkaliphilus metalliredigens (strain QYMF) TaxID=293826 RepID=A6TWD2_ALKMQ|nr:thiamine pyrophosphate-dependent enzyme [Alkaliphilus metalliredigens]ABR50500.1 thiamine pyrophosphate protein domain protein TPP-binding [Alkaliphilus metalliredigens QYMF]
MEKVFSRSKGLSDVPFSFCPGCTHGIIMRLIAEILEELDIIEDTIGISPVGCAGFCQDFFTCDFVGAPHGRAQAVGIGVKRAMPDRTVFTYQGDGDMAAIGTQHAIHAAARGEKITSIMVNNAIYGMTGGQMAPTTLEGMKTSTSPYGRDTILTGAPMDFPKVIAALEGAVYVASVSVDSPKNIKQAKAAIKKAFKVQQAGLGFALVSVLSTCPTNWGMTPVESLQWLRDNMMPIYEMGELKMTEEVKSL